MFFYFFLNLLELLKLHHQYFKKNIFDQKYRYIAGPLPHANSLKKDKMTVMYLKFSAICYLFRLCQNYRKMDMNVLTSMKFNKKTKITKHNFFLKEIVEIIFFVFQSINNIS